VSLPWFGSAAEAVQRSDSALGAFYRRMKSENGTAQATTATAHKIARIVYHELSTERNMLALGRPTTKSNTASES
jgi:hypothetical protein